MAEKSAVKAVESKCDQSCLSTTTLPLLFICESNIQNWGRWSEIEK